MSLAADAGPMTVSDGWVGGSCEKGDCEAGAPTGSGVSDDGGSGDFDVVRLDRKGTLSFESISA